MYANRNAVPRSVVGLVMMVVSTCGALAGTPTRVAAQTESAEAGARARAARSVGAHAYSQFETIEWPFVATRVASRTGFGTSRFTLRGLQPFPEREVDGQFGNLTQAFDLHVAIADWIGVEVGVQGGAIGGLDSAGSLFVGANGFAGVRLSGVLRIVETDVLLLSARTDVSAIAAGGIAPARTVVALRSSPDQSVRLIRPDFSGNRGSLGGSLAAALTSSEWLGFMGSFRADARRVELADLEDYEGWLGGALGVSLSFGTFGVPLQILLGSRVSWNFGDDVGDVALSVIEPVNDVAVEPEAGFYYADPARPELELGLTTSFAFTEASERGRVGVGLAYWW